MEKRIEFAVVCAATWFWACATAAVLPPWENPYVTSSNRLPARAVVVPCESREVAVRIAGLEIERSASRYLESLNGMWDFNWSKDPWTFDAKAWGKIKVPGCWELQGAFDPVQYLNVAYAFAKDPPYVTREPPKDYNTYEMRNPVGHYRRTFTVPAEWAGRRVVIHFGGVSSALELRVNGVRVGYSEDSRLPAEFDLTPFLKPSGEPNLLEADVYRWCDGSYLECQDMWRLAGIFRDVWLVAEAKDAPKDLVVTTDLSDDFSRGTVTVCDENGKVLFTRTHERPRLWSAETPHLETAVFQTGGDRYAVRYGFRKVAIEKGVFKINGRRILVKGTNRHEMSPTGGYTVTKAEMVRDIEIMKSLNVNAVRTSHYPDDPLWYDLCDEMGLYVLSEVNIESHAMGYAPETTLANRPDYLGQHVERGVRMVQTLRNHPSIYAWSLGNEAGYGTNFVHEAAAMRRLDPSRPLHYEGACYTRTHKVTAETDFECPMYAPLSLRHDTREHGGQLATEEYFKRVSEPRPYIYCEYAHAMGNSGGDLSEFWKYPARYPQFQGGFIWDFADQALWKNGQVRHLAFGGDFGDKPNHSCFNCNGFVNAERKLHPGAYEVWHCYRNVFVDLFDWTTGVARVRNGFAFRTLGGVQARWELTVDGEKTSAGDFTLGEVPAGETVEKVVDIRNAVAPESAGEQFLTLRFYEKEVEIAHAQFKRPGGALRVRQAVPGGAWTRSVKGDDEVWTCGETVVAVDRRTNLPKAMTRGGRPLISGPMRWNFWRATTDNDRGNWFWDRLGFWRTCDGTGMTRVRLDFLPEGAVRVDATLAPTNGLPEIPRVGLTFEVPKTFADVRWFGLGPWENYCDRATAATVGIWQMPIAELNHDTYVKPCEQGYRTDVRWLELSGGGTKLKVSAVEPNFGFNVWDYTQAAAEGPLHWFEVRRSDVLTVNVDAAQMGVGGDDCWGAQTHAWWRLLPGREYRLSFVIGGETR